MPILLPNRVSPCISSLRNYWIYAFSGQISLNTNEEWQTQLAQLHGDPYWRSLPQMYVQVQENLVASDRVLIADEELAAIRCPTLVMHGVRDRIVPVEYAYMLHEHIPGSYLMVFDAGHAAHLRGEREFTQVVMKFFADPSTFSR